MNITIPMRYLLIFSLFTSLAHAEWVTLFNGQDLAGWGAKEGVTEHNGYVVKDGVIEAQPECKLLVTDGSYTDYVFDFEYKLTRAANNGLSIHYPGHGDGAWQGMELQILDNENAEEKYGKLKPVQLHGSLYSLAAAKTGFQKPAGEWNHQRVIVSGDLVSVILNGHLILSVSLDEIEKANPEHEGAKRREGRLAFCGHGDVIELRNLRILEL